MEAGGDRTGRSAARIAARTLADLTKCPAPARSKPGAPPGTGRVVQNPGTGRVPAPSPPPTVVLRRATRRDAGRLPGRQIPRYRDDAGMIIVWDLRPARIGRLAGHTARVACLAFSPDGKILASGDDGGTVKIWNPTSGQELRTHRAANLNLDPPGGLLAR